ncbi:MAG: glycoside hydrolase family 3 protein [Christensenellaceae bacterium]|nr:glycoside hydrolase family 3 protein [Christensenellaceae bacterium]
MDIKEIISKMSLKEKVAFCTGSDMWHTKALKELGVEQIKVSDGPHGLRCQESGDIGTGINDSLPATCFPTAVTAANTWDPDLIFEEGKAIGEEALEYGVSVVLGPGANIKRDPRGGRNFEYYSEDPYQAGKMAAAFIKGVQSNGVGTSLKHFACNNQEYKRQSGNSIVDERALREIYLKAFEIAVKEGRPDTIMCSYNKINGVYSSDNENLLTKILRDEWGFDGLVMTDWGAMSDRIKGFKAGCDLNMPGGSAYMEEAVIKAVESGELGEAVVDRSVERILRLVKKGLKNRKKYSFNREAHDLLAGRIACEGAVLLKNEDKILPLNKEDIGVFGYFAEDIRYQGAGSSHINPTALHQFKELYPEIPYVAATDKSGELIDLESALALAKTVKTAVIFAGLPDSYESEGYDRENMALPKGYDRLVEEISKVNGNTVVVLLGGSAMETPWADSVKAILYMGLPGQRGAASAMDLLTGKANPSGKLSESWPFKYEDAATSETFGMHDPEYRESVYVGYRYYDKADVPVRFAYGHGLSYTSFDYSDIGLEDGKVSVEVRNTGSVSGSEVVQLYVSPKDAVSRPVKELKGFRKITLMPGESRRVYFDIEDDFFTVYDGGSKKTGGEYSILIGSGSLDIRGEIAVNIEGEPNRYAGSLKGTWYEAPSGKPSREDFEKLLGEEIKPYEKPRKGSYTIDNSILEMKDDSFIMRIMYGITKGTVSKTFKKEERTMENPAYKMMVTAATDSPLRAAVISSGGMLTDALAEGLLFMANGHFIKGLKRLLKK